MAGRPREFDRVEALKKARDVFWKQGFESTTMTDLVEALGLASARIYAAFGSKEALFREAIADYENNEGGFADRALRGEPTIFAAIEHMFNDAIVLYTRPGGPKGCMVVSSATNCSGENVTVREWLAEHRQERTRAIIERLEQAQQDGELVASADPGALGDFLSALLHGISVQAMDGVPRKRLLALVTPALEALRLQCSSTILNRSVGP
ncbi:TetR family transcriptional regulator [Acetobacter malorum]|uniref:TetR family transcriptional regulator n=1 Tax=Acetobacter malorum TaxID=178901 RepID=A0A149RQH1_9PROT|nr:TetR/AcrR family transcriptional regulator [Acetobacter malorum]KXV16394.1 TetR family transcriptional regulator [Acetobacter malorum]